MKLLLLPIALVILASCHQSAQTNTATTSAKNIPSDSVAIADAVHGFYTWYVTFSQDTTHHIDFTDDRGEHLKLIQPKLERYYAHFKASGFVSDAFITNEMAFYKQCSEVWQQELIDEVPSCMDADKYFCAQEWEPTFWTTSPIRIKTTSPDQVVATLYGKSYGSAMERNVSLKKENGKWLITSIECDMGLSTATTGSQLKTLNLNEKYITSKMAQCPVLAKSEFARLGLGNIVSDEKMKAPRSKICLLDTLLSIDRGKVIVVSYDSGNETEAWMVQYGNSPQILYWGQVYYADLVEYIKTVNTKVSGNEVIVTTSTDIDGNRSAKVQKYVLTNQLIFERANN